MYCIIWLEREELFVCEIPKSLWQSQSHCQPATPSRGPITHPNILSFHYYYYYYYYYYLTTFFLLKKKKKKNQHKYLKHLIIIIILFSLEWKTRGAHLGELPAWLGAAWTVGCVTVILDGDWDPASSLVLISLLYQYEISNPPPSRLSILISTCSSLKSIYPSFGTRVIEAGFQKN